MTRKEALNRAREALTTHNIADASLEAEVLLKEALKISRVQLYLDPDKELSSEQEETFWHLIERRISGEPSAYITGHREFYGLDFYIEPGVFIPRPESELLVEEALKLAQKYPVSVIAEIGTGSGAIAICLALNLPQTKIYPTDISALALKVARINCQKYGVENRVQLLQGNLLDPLPEAADLIVANLPYVRASEATSVSTEPLLALNGGSDGLDKIRQLCYQLGDKLKPGGHVLLEIGLGQREALSNFLKRLFTQAEIEVVADLGGIDRVVRLALP